MGEAYERDVTEEMNICVLGDDNVGKTAIVQRFAMSEFNDNYTPTVGVDLETRVLEVDGALTKLHIADLSGQKSFLWCAKKHLKEAEAYVLVYDVTSRESFENIAYWLKAVRRTAREHNIPIILCGNKIDLRHKKQVTASEAKEYGIPEGMRHIETSALDSKNLSCMFYILAQEVLRHRKLGCYRPIGVTDFPYDTPEIHEDPSTETKVVDDGPEYTHLFKIMLLGSPRSGKTALRYRFSRDYFPVDYVASAGLDYGTRTVMVDRERVKVQVWDLSGDDVFESTRKGYYRGANGFVIVYDVTDPASFSRAEMLLKELDMYEQSDAPKIIVGNKCDMGGKRQVDYTTAAEWADGWRVPIIETSARSGANVDAVFLKVTMALKRQLAPWKRLYNFS